MQPQAYAVMQPQAYLHEISGGGRLLKAIPASGMAPAALGLPEQTWPPAPPRRSRSPSCHAALSLQRSSGSWM